MGIPLSEIADNSTNSTTADNQVIDLKKKLIKQEEELEEYKKKAEENLRSVRRELQQAELEQNRLTADYTTRCNTALEALEQKLDDGRRWDGIDPCPIRATAREFLVEARNVVADQSHHPTTAAKVQLLADSIELVHDTLENATSPKVNVEKLERHYNAIETKAKELEGGSALERSLGRKMMGLGVALCAIGIIGAFVGLSLFATFGLSFGVTFASFAIFGAGVVLINQGDKKIEENQLTATLPQKLLLFGDSAKDKAGKIERDDISCWESVRRSFR